MERFSKGQNIMANVMDGSESCPNCFTERTHTVPKQTIDPLRCGHYVFWPVTGNEQRPALDHRP